MRCAPVLAAVRVLAETVAQLPVHLYRRARRWRPRARRRPSGRGAAGRRGESAGPPACEFRLVMQTQLALHGNAYAYVNRTAGGRGRGADPARPAQRQRRAAIAAPWCRATSSPTPTGQRREYDRTEILHIRGLGAGLLRRRQPGAPGARGHRAVAGDGEARRRPVRPRRAARRRPEVPAAADARKLGSACAPASRRSSAAAKTPAGPSSWKTAWSSSRCSSPRSTRSSWSCGASSSRRSPRLAHPAGAAGDRWSGRPSPTSRSSASSS